MPRKIAFFPGVFDTVYQSQLDYAKLARKQFGFDQVIFVNYNNYPHQEHVPSVKSRFNTVNTAIKSYKYFDSLGIEFDTKKKVHLYNVVKYLGKTFQQEKVNLLLGAHWLKTPNNFYKWNQMLDMVNLHVIPTNQEENSVKIIDGQKILNILERFKAYISSMKVEPRFQKVVTGQRSTDSISQHLLTAKNVFVEKYSDKEIPPVKKVYERRSRILI